MPDVLGIVRVIREPKKKLTNPAETGDWKVVFDDAAENTISHVVRLGKDRTILDPAKLAGFLFRAIILAIKTDAKKAKPKLSSRMSKEANELWPGELPEGQKVWIDVAILKNQDGYSCEVHDKMDDSKQTFSLNESGPQETTAKTVAVKSILDKITALVKHPIKDARQSEMFAPIPVPEKPTTATPQPMAPAPPPPPPDAEQIDMFSESKRDYRDEIRLSAVKKKTSD